MLSSQIGKQIKAQRLRLGLGQKELAERAGVSRAVLSRLESLRGEPVQTDSVDRLSHALGASVSVSLNGAEGTRVEERLRQRLREEELRARHLRIAMDLCADPRAAKGRIARARTQVALWQERRSCSPTYVERWSEILGRSPREVALAMTSLGEWENALYQNSPWSFMWS